MKVTIIGAGNVGSSVAYAMILRNVASELILIDRDETLLLARDLELGQSIAALNLNIKLTCTSEYDECVGSDIVIFCAGLARKDGQSRDELLQINADIMLDCAKKVKVFVNDPLFIILTNPVDFLLNTLFEHNIFDSKKIIAMAGTLDNARFKYELAKKFQCNTKDIDTKLLGFHNDDMVLLKSYSLYKGQKISELLDEEEFDDIENEVKTGGAKVIKHLKTSAYLAPAAACIRMVEAIRTGEFLPMSVILHGEFGIENKAFGVLARINLNGVIELLSLELDEEERNKLKKSLQKYNYIKD
ncbi:malate dehydrogenase [Campylobacter sp. MIT 12-8780]|uniref:malate dehydrogenase n=1 Tax=unclassified Campylobacter TaxID=2593542 RepID=UPI00115D2B31|nr:MULTISPECIES: malate dehydrogenase [unclassified Campylobacter]NDJ26444.1 malate dehydrogenase [Campylobacter sp. MIT 19-121]TQR43017.1 malate dehydrogenase [Campylobacter sp. MIT 12-8780]